jgi:ribosomal protein S18 acetylase RimI-like enzyme
MTAITIPILTEIPQLRSLNILHDLPSVADLVEACFADTMDTEGRRYIQQMRSAGRNNQFLHWANTAVETASMPLSGYVWEENGEIVGNVSLIPYRCEGRKIYLIANVAVRPDHRRKGIGCALTVTAMHHASQRRAEATWLHVRDDNPEAIALYLSLGFRERLRRTTWQAKTDRNACADGLGIILSPRYAPDWPQQESWIKRLYPDLLAWYQPLPWTSLRPGLWPSLYRFFVDTETRHWTAHTDGRLLGALTWHPVYGHDDRLWAAVPPEGSERALTALLLHVRSDLAWRQTLSLDLPAGEYTGALEAAGFHPHRTLVWMQADGTSAAGTRKLL